MRPNAEDSDGSSEDGVEEIVIEESNERGANLVTLTDTLADINNSIETLEKKLEDTVNEEIIHERATEDCRSIELDIQKKLIQAHAKRRIYENENSGDGIDIEVHAKENATAKKEIETLMKKHNAIRKCNPSHASLRQGFESAFVQNSATEGDRFPSDVDSIQKYASSIIHRAKNGGGSWGKMPLRSLYSAAKKYLSGASKSWCAISRLGMDPSVFTDAKGDYLLKMETLLEKMKNNLNIDSRRILTGKIACFQEGTFHTSKSIFKSAKEQLMKRILDSTTACGVLSHNDGANSNNSRAHPGKPPLMPSDDFRKLTKAEKNELINWNLEMFFNYNERPPTKEDVDEGTILPSALSRWRLMFTTNPQSVGFREKLIAECPNAKIAANQMRKKDVSNRADGYIYFKDDAREQLCECVLIQEIRSVVYLASNGVSGADELNTRLNFLNAVKFIYDQHRDDKDTDIDAIRAAVKSLGDHHDDWAGDCSALIDEYGDLALSNDLIMTAIRVQLATTTPGWVQDELNVRRLGSILGGTMRANMFQDFKANYSAHASTKFSGNMCASLQDRFRHFNQKYDTYVERFFSNEPTHLQNHKIQIENKTADQYFSQILNTQASPPRADTGTTSSAHRSGSRRSSSSTGTSSPTSTSTRGSAHRSGSRRSSSSTGTSSPTSTSTRGSAHRSGSRRSSSSTGTGAGARNTGASTSTSSTETGAGTTNSGHGSGHSRANSSTGIGDGARNSGHGSGQGHASSSARTNGHRTRTSRARSRTNTGSGGLKKPCRHQ